MASAATFALDRNQFLDTPSTTLSKISDNTFASSKVEINFGQILKDPAGTIDPFPFITLIFKGPLPAIFSSIIAEKKSTEDGSTNSIKISSYYHHHVDVLKVFEAIKGANILPKDSLEGAESLIRVSPDPRSLWARL
jgi:hypothetical protein